MVAAADMHAAGDPVALHPPQHAIVDFDQSSQCLVRILGHELSGMRGLDGVDIAQ